MNDASPSAVPAFERRLAGALALATVALLALVAFDLVPWLRGEGSGVWIWAHAPRRPSAALLPALGAAALLVALAASPLARLAAPSRARRATLLAAITLAGSGLAAALLAPEPGGIARTLIIRTIDPNFTSYHTVALAEMPEGAAAFLATHHEQLATLPLHAATHPPGPSLYYRALLAAFEARPRASDALVRALDLDDRAALARLRPAQTPASIAAALTGALGLLVAGAAAAWPVSRLVTRLAGDPEAGLRAAAIWPLVPAMALMSPEFDQALALPVAAAAAALVAAAQARRPATAVAAGLAAGLAAAAALFLSYGALAFLSGAALAAAVLPAPGSRRPAAVGFGVAALAAGALFFATGLLGHRPLAAALDAVALHGNRHTWGRGWAVSTGLNLADTLLFFGPPLLGLLAVRAGTGHPGGRAGFFTLPAAARWSALLVAAFALFLLSGTVRGEAGRIFLPWMPLLLAAAVTTADGRRSLSPRLAGALALLFAVWTISLRLLLRVP
jgi:hypothetical protein